MTLKARNKVLCLVLAGLLLAMLALPLAGSAVFAPTGLDDDPHSTLFETFEKEEAPAAVIACSGGSDGHCGT